jgi:hypothetical protein
MAKSDDLLAVAFTDVNGNDKYNPHKDTLIAALVDTNHDGIVSAGDTIQFGSYPSVVGGTYTGDDYVITGTALRLLIPVFEWTRGSKQSAGLQICTKRCSRRLSSALLNLRRFCVMESMPPSRTTKSRPVRYPVVSHSPIRLLWN